MVVRSIRGLDSVLRFLLLLLPALGTVLPAVPSHCSGTSESKVSGATGDRGCGGMCQVLTAAGHCTRYSGFAPVFKRAPPPVRSIGR